MTSQGLLSIVLHVHVKIPLSCSGALLVKHAIHFAGFFNKFQTTPMLDIAWVMMLCPVKSISLVQYV